MQAVSQTILFEQLLLALQALKKTDLKGPLFIGAYK